MSKTKVTREINVDNTYWKYINANDNQYQLVWSKTMLQVQAVEERFLG
ncbi:MAG: hypothetical protein IJ668_11940 [Selenomonadaceae bacterium]|nr:hypothetical protein [Selenomonadaceae bacterium]